MSKSTLKSIKSPVSSDHVRFNDKVEYSGDTNSPKKIIENESSPKKQVEKDTKLKSAKSVDAMVKADSKSTPDRKVKSAKSTSSLQTETTKPSNVKVASESEEDSKKVSKSKSTDKKSKTKSDDSLATAPEKKTNIMDTDPVESTANVKPPKKSVKNSKSSNAKDSGDEKSKLQIEVLPAKLETPVAKPNKSNSKGKKVSKDDEYEYRKEGNDEDDNEGEEDEGSQENPMTEEELKEHMYSLFQHIYTVIDGAVMKIKDGTAGNIPANDNFPLFKASKQRRVSINWKHPDPLHWAIILHNIPSDGSKPTLRRVISIADVSEVFIKNTDSKSFRVYCEAEVSQFTPVEYSGMRNIPAVAWADAIYSIADLQVLDSEDILKYKAMYDEEFGVRASEASTMMDGGVDASLHASASGDESSTAPRDESNLSHEGQGDERDAETTAAAGEGSEKDARRRENSVDRESRDSSHSHDLNHGNHDSEGEEESGNGSPTKQKRDGLLRRVTSMFSGGSSSSSSSARHSPTRASLSHAHSSSDVLGGGVPQLSPVKRPTLLQRISSLGSSSGSSGLNNSGSNHGGANDLLNGTNNALSSPNRGSGSHASSSSLPDSPKSAALSHGFLSMSLMSGSSHPATGGDVSAAAAPASPKRPLSMIREGSEAEEHEASVKTSPTAAAGSEVNQSSASSAAGLTSPAAVSAAQPANSEKLYHQADRDALASHITKKRLSLLVLPMDIANAVPNNATAVAPSTVDSSAAAAVTGEEASNDKQSGTAIAPGSPSKRRAGPSSTGPVATLLPRRSVLDTLLKQQQTGSASPEERSQHRRDDYYNEYPAFGVSGGSPLRSPRNDLGGASDTSHQYSSSFGSSLADRNAAMSRIFSLQNPPMQVISLQASTSSEIRMVPGGSALNHHQSLDPHNISSDVKSSGSPIKPRVTFSPVKKASPRPAPSVSKSPRSWLRSTPAKSPSSDAGDSSVSGSATSASSLREQKLFHMLTGIKDAITGTSAAKSSASESGAAAAAVAAAAKASKGRLSKPQQQHHHHHLDSATSSGSDHDHHSHAAVAARKQQSLEDLKQQGAERQGQYRRWQQKQRQFVEEANRNRVYSSDSDYNPTHTAAGDGNGAGSHDVSHLQLSSSKPANGDGVGHPLEAPNVSFDLGTPIKPIAFNDLLIEAAARTQAIADAAAAAPPVVAVEAPPVAQPHKHRHGAYPTVFQHTEQLLKPENSLQLTMDILEESKEAIRSSQELINNSPLRQGGSTSAAASPIPPRTTVASVAESQPSPSVMPSAPRRRSNPTSSAPPVTPDGISDSTVAKVNIAPTKTATVAASSSAIVPPAIAASDSPTFGKEMARQFFTTGTVPLTGVVSSDSQNAKPRINSTVTATSVPVKTKTTTPIKTAASAAAAAAAAAVSSSPAAAMATSTSAFVPSEGKHLLHAQFQKRSVVCGIVPQSVLLINGHLSVQHTVVEEYPSSSAAAAAGSAHPKPVFYLSVTEVGTNDTLLVPLRDIISADIDANATGLFRLCLTRYFDHSYYYPQIHNNRVLSPLKKSHSPLDPPQASQQHQSIFSKMLNGTNDADPTAPINLILKTTSPDRPKEWLELVFRYKKKGKV